MRRKVLAVDDSTQVLSLYERIFRDVVTVELLTAKNGHEALTAVGHHPDIALILLDIHMPGMNGPTFLEALRAQEPPTSQIPVIVVATEAGHEAVQRRMDAGAFIEKPFDAEELKRRVLDRLAIE